MSSHTYNLRSKTIKNTHDSKNVQANKAMGIVTSALTERIQSRVDQMTKGQLCDYCIKCWRDFQTLQEIEIVNLFYACTLLVEKYINHDKMIILADVVIVNLDQAITLDRFCNAEKEMMEEYRNRIVLHKLKNVV